MARLARLGFPGLPHHVIQRGHNRQPIFQSAADYQFMRDLLRESASAAAVEVHAYVLMPNHFHLLLTPRTEPALPQLLQTIGRRYVRYFNSAAQRSGTLWDGRYRSTILQAERYLLPCMASIDLNPVRAALCHEASDYPWSSHLHYIGRQPEKWLTPHPLFWALGNTPFAREAAYAALVASGVGVQQQQSLTDATLKGWALGDAAFLQRLQKDTPRRLTKGQAGRPVRVKPL
ncbi:MAG: transposase [Rhodoferax sp.]|nr:transposase [Rhodoferax sp.]